MAKKSITARWVLNTLCAIIFVLFCIIIVVSVLFKEQYYETVRVTLDSRATNVVSSYFSISNDSSDDAFNLRAKEFVEDFSDKSVMEVWVIDRSGTSWYPPADFLSKTKNTRITPRLSYPIPARLHGLAE